MKIRVVTCEKSFHNFENFFIHKQNDFAKEIVQTEQK